MPWYLLGYGIQTNICYLAALVRYQLGLVNMVVADALAPTCNIKVSQVNMMAADVLAPIWCQVISYHSIAFNCQYQVINIHNVNSLRPSDA